MNRLANESSPYLLQHKNNPVDWFPWGEEALEKAKKEDKPLLISIGYSSCHWCHVMEKECFEDEEVAKLMNEHFVCIKVDREERPDIDQTYMDAVQAISGQGGWPLNCFALPNQEPFFGGTYFPKQNWISNLKKVADLYKNQREEVEKYASNLMNHVNNHSALIVNEIQDDILKEDLLKNGVDVWSDHFDYALGGTSRAPKFPLPSNYLLLMRQAVLEDDKKLLEYVNTSLQNMARGGIYDQINGGFSRYSTDVRWHVPHFEKMLYDNGQLIELFAEAYYHTNQVEYKEVALDIIRFVENELKNEEGLYMSALDADSEGVEGKYYVYSKTELQEALTEEEFSFAELFYQINSNSFWEGNYILQRIASKEEFAKANNVDVAIVSEYEERIKEKLFQLRQTKVRPGLDSKVLTSWNALYISGLSTVANFIDEEYLDLAENTIRKLVKKVLLPDYTVVRTFRNETPINGFLDDYALLTKALLDLYTVNGKENYAKMAYDICQRVIELFYDMETGLFKYSVSEDSIGTKMPLFDDVIPSGNSIMANNLFILGHLFENSQFLNTAEKMIRKVAKGLEKELGNFTNWGLLAQKMIYTYAEVVCTGNDAKSFRKEILASKKWHNLLVYSTQPVDIPLFANRFLENKTAIFVCQHHACLAPVHSVDEAVKLIE